jgi:molybdopterin converting factor subunit 1
VKVRVRLFAALREVLGEEELDLELPDGTTVSALWDELQTKNASLAPFTRSVQFAVNHDFVDRDTELSADDEVAFLPPVSGG